MYNITADRHVSHCRRFYVCELVISENVSRIVHGGQQTIHEICISIQIRVNGITLIRYFLLHPIYCYVMISAYWMCPLSFIPHNEQASRVSTGEGILFIEFYTVTKCFFRTSTLYMYDRLRSLRVHNDPPLKSFSSRMFSVVRLWLLYKSQNSAIIDASSEFS